MSKKLQEPKNVWHAWMSRSFVANPVGLLPGQAAADQYRGPKGRLIVATHITEDRNSSGLPTDVKYLGPVTERVGEAWRIIHPHGTGTKKYGAKL